MSVSTLGSGIDRAQAAIHEAVHSALSPGNLSLAASRRAGIGQFLYDNVHFFKYAEETLAETTALVGTRRLAGMSLRAAVRGGANFSLNGSYFIGASRIPLSRATALFQGAAGAALFGGGLYLGYRASSYISP
jgi:hypothetical protein